MQRIRSILLHEHGERIPREGGCLGSDWVSPTVGRMVLFRHLFSQASGLGSYGGYWDKHASQLRTIGDYRMIASGHLASDPGARCEYCAMGFILLGAIIEKVTGTTYYDRVPRLIVDPPGCRARGSAATTSAVRASPSAKLHYKTPRKGRGTLISSPCGGVPAAEPCALDVSPFARYANSRTGKMILDKRQAARPKAPFHL